MEFLSPLFFGLVLIYISTKLKISGREQFPRFLFEGILALKFVTSLGLYVLYTKYYTVRKDADIFKYYDSSIVITNYLKDNLSAFWEVMIHSKLPKPVSEDTVAWFINGYNIVNTNQIIIKIHVLLNFITFSNYHANAFIFCFLAYIGSLFLYNKVLKHYPNINKWLGLLIFTIPSILLWTSAPLKETLVVFTLFISLGYLIEFINSNNWKHWAYALFWLFLGSFSKPYFSIALIPISLIIPIKMNKPIYKYILFIAGFAGFVALTSNFSDFNILYRVIQKQHDFLNHAEAEAAGSLIYLPRMEPSFWGAVKTLPIAFYNILFKPLPWDSLNPMFLLASLENVFILLLIALSFSFRKRNTNIATKEISYFLAFFCLIIIFLIGLTTPVLGAIVRYKAPILPLIVIVCLINIDFEKLTTYVSSKKHS